MKQDAFIPQQQEGIQTNTESKAEFQSKEDAQAFFSTVKQRLFRVSQWHDLAGAATAVFKLNDAEGHEVERDPQVGDHFSISIPGPGNASGEGLDWVRIESIEEQDDLVSIRVRPAPNPHGGEGDVAHFFAEEATSNFIVKIEGKEVIAGVYGRNEKPNTAAENLVDKVRNAVVATGAISGFSKIQWKSLVNGLVKQ